MSFLRETITILAVLLVLALTAALAAPLFIDWSAHRGWVEERLSAALGGEVKVAGEIDLRLLPAPRMAMDSVSWRGAGEGAPRLEASRVRLEIALAPLMQGAVRFVEARLEQPRFSAALGPDGALGLPQPGPGGGVVAFERIEIRDGAVALARAGGDPLVLSGLDIDADAASLQGPFRGSGSYQAQAGRGTFRFGAGVAEGDRLRVKFTLEPGAGAPQADLDGALIAQTQGAGTLLRFEGSAALGGVVQAAGVDVPWRASGTLAAGAAQARLEPMELRFGPLERQSTATGLAVIDATGPALSVRLSAPQVDVDRLLDSKDAAGEAMARLQRVIAQALENPARPRAMAMTFEVSTPALLLGGDTITEASLSIERPRRGDDRLALSANLPGRSQISIEGVVEGGAAARFAGKAQVGARDLPRLAEWVERGDGDLADRLRGLPFRVLEASGQIEISRRAFAARGLQIRADRSTLTGSAAFTAPVAGEPARLFADFNSPALDLDGLPNLRGPARALQDADLNLSIDARAVRLAGVGGAVVDSGRIRGKLTRSAGRLDLERLSVENLSGATLTASGRLDADAAKLDARLEAQRLVELAALVRRVAPGPLADLLNERAVSLSPARIDVTADAAMKDGALDLRNLRIDGSARGTRITGAVRPSGDDVEAEGELASNDTPMLLRQLGVEALPLSGAPRSRITLRARGSVARGYDAEANGDIAGASLSFRGRVGDRAGRMSGDGRARIASKDATQLMQVLALAWPDAQISIPLDMAGDVSLSGEAIEARALSGALAGARVSGDLRLAAGEGGARRALTGALSVDRMAFDAIAALALGPPQSLQAGRQGGAQTWSDRPFAPGLADPPPSRIDLRVADMSLRGLDARAFHGQLVLGQGVVAIEDMSARIGAAHVAGRMALRRDKTDASLAASLDVKTALDVRDQIAANVSARIEVAATGRSERALAGTLAGSGRARFTDIVIPRAASEALDTVVALAEKDAVPPDERAIGAALQRALDRAPLRARSAEFDLLAAGGVLRLQPVKLDVLVADAVLAASFDLRSLSSEQVLDIISRHPPPNWTGPAPRVRLVWSGPPDKASRTIDAASLVNGLSARAIVRESARIEAFEADIRERSMFNRRLRADEWRRQRELEIRAFLAEQEKQEKARLEAERRAKEQQRLLEELARPAPAPPLQLPGAAPR